MSYNTLVKNDIFILNQSETNKQIFEIVFLRRQKTVFIDSLIQTRLIQNVTLSDDYKTIRFKAFTVKSFHKYKHNTSRVNYNTAIQMLSSLTKQLAYLIAHEYVFLGYNTKNIIVINDSVFVFLDSELLTDVFIKNDNMYCSIRYPFSTNDFYVSPELFRISEIPSIVSYKISYFSLGFLLFEAVYGSEDLYKEYLRFLKNRASNSFETFVKGILNSETLSFMKHSKLYWLLERSLVEDPLDRSLLFL